MGWPGERDNHDHDQAKQPECKGEGLLLTLTQASRGGPALHGEAEEPEHQHPSCKWMEETRLFDGDVFQGLSLEDATQPR